MIIIRIIYSLYLFFLFLVPYFSVHLLRYFLDQPPIYDPSRVWQVVLSYLLYGAFLVGLMILNNSKIKMLSNLGKILSYPLERIVTIPWKLLRQTHFAVIHFWTRFILRDTFIYSFEDLADTMHEIWGEYLEQNGFVQYKDSFLEDPQVGPFIKRIWVHDTQKGYVHVIGFQMMERSRKMNFYTNVILPFNIVEHTPGKTLTWEGINFLDLYAENTNVFRKSLFIEGLKKTFTLFNERSSFTIFSEFPKPFDTISPQEIVNDPKIVEDYYLNLAPQEPLMYRYIFTMGTIAAYTNNKKLFLECVEIIGKGDLYKNNLLVQKDLADIAKEKGWNEITFPPEKPLEDML